MLTPKLLETFTTGGVTYGLYADGNLYVHNVDGTKTYSQNIFDPGFYPKNYRTLGGVIEYWNGSSWVAVRRAYADHFNQYGVVGDLLSASAWHNYQLNPNPPFPGSAGNLIELITEGTGKDVKFSVPAGVGTYKASINRQGFFFTEGDRVNISAVLQVDAASAPGYLTFLDFGSTFFATTSEFRFAISSGYLVAELEWLTKIPFNQNAVLFPLNTRVNLAIEILLKSDLSGEVIVWQNGVKILDANGRTLQRNFAVMDNLEIGVTASTDNAIRAVTYSNVEISGYPTAPAPTEVPLTI